MLLARSNRCPVLLAGFLLAAMTPVAHSQMLWTKVAPKASPAKRMFHAMAYDSARQRVVMFGGQRAGSYHYPPKPPLTGTWEYDGSTWVRRSTAASPPVRTFHTMAYDAARGVVVMFGGSDNMIPASAVDETWEYDGKNWKKRVLKSSPPALAGHAMVYDSHRKVIVVFGGTKNTIGDGRVWGQMPVISNETWEYDGKDWRRRLMANAPTRSMHMMVYDTARRVLVMTGGVSINGRFGVQHSTTDPWEWGGSKIGWVQRSPAIPGPYPSWSRMVYDRARSRSVWIGVRYLGGNPTHISETWEWDGQQWRKQPGIIGPLRSYHAVAYDSKRERVVLFSGAYTVATDETWEYYPTHKGGATSVGSGCAGGAGTPKIKAQGPPILGSQDFCLRIDSARPNSSAFVGLSLKPANLRFGTCTFFIDVLSAPPTLLLGRTNSTGSLTLPISIPFNPALSGVRLEAQGFVSDPNGRFFAGLAFTNGLRLEIGD
jgi:hypothetical protein